MIEIFKDIEGYEGYQISNHGRVKSLRFGKEKILKPLKDGKKYLFVILCKQGKRKMCKIHRLVASTFIPNPNNYPQVNHKDEDKTNNQVENLEFCDAKYNSNYGTRNQRVAASCANHPKRSKPVMCLETGIIYPSVNEVKRQLGFNLSNISRCCRGKYKTAYSFHWKFVS